jgi:putative tryptophan/tyrosine transport system substrate-binding protein
LGKSSSCKRQEILIEAVPGLRRMAPLADANKTTGVKLDVLQEAARARNIELSIYRVAKDEEIAAAIDMAKASGAATLNVLASPILDANRKLVMDRVAALRLPMYQWTELAEEGGFAGYGPRPARFSATRSASCTIASARQRQRLEEGLHRRSA